MLVTPAGAPILSVRMLRRIAIVATVLVAAALAAAAVPRSTGAPDAGVPRPPIFGLRASDAGPPSAPRRGPDASVPRQPPTPRAIDAGQPRPAAPTDAGSPPAPAR